MGFVPVVSKSIGSFNSSSSQQFKKLIEDSWNNQIQIHNSRIPSKTFAPSSMRCDRKSWFRLRGVEPDRRSTSDRTLDFSATLGTACHEFLQNLISSTLGSEWISVKDYLAENPIPHTYKLEESGFETRVEILDLPIRFAVDGIIRLHGKYYILEIKSCDYSAFSNLTDVKPEHYDQTCTYSTLLGIENIMFVYIDRMYGDIKCYEKYVDANESKHIIDRMTYVMKCVDTNIAPDRLPKDDKWCSMCPYYIKCNQW